MDEPRIDRFRAARRDPASAVLEGFHPLKHALRFEANVLEIVTADPDRLEALARMLAPDVLPRLHHATVVPPDVFARLSPTPLREPVIALARRPPSDPAAALASSGAAPVVLLERPRHLGNVGAVVRVAAAAGAAAVLTTGEHDPWHPQALRGAAGLHFALTVGRIEAMPPHTRPLVALDPEGEPLRPGLIPARALLAFGSERHGLGDALRSAAALRVAIPMRPRVSSLSLATAVAIALYTPPAPDPR